MIMKEELEEGEIDENEEISLNQLTHEYIDSSKDIPDF